MRRGRLPGNAGQMTIEMILILTTLLGVMMYISKTSREQGWMKSLVSGPWKPLRGMIEDGVWIAAGVASRAKHPHVRERHASAEGETVK